MNKKPKRGRGTMTRAQRREVLEASIRKIVSTKGLDNLTRVTVAADAKCTEAMISNHFGSAPEMRIWAVEDMVARKDLTAINLMALQGYELPAMSRALRKQCGL